MLDTGALSRAIGRIYATLLDDDAERGWLDLVCDVVGAEHAMLSESGHAMPVMHASRIDDDLLPLARHLSATTMYDPALARMPPGSAHRLSDYVALRELIRTDVYQHFVRPLRGGHALAFTWSHARGRTAVAICRDLARGRDYADHELAAMQPLLSHLHTAYELRARALQGQAALRQAHATLDAMRDGVVVVDRSRRLQYANAAGAALLRAGDALRSVGGRLSAAGARDEGQLQALVADMLSCSPPDSAAGAPRLGTGGMFAIVRAPPQRPLLVSAMPSPDAAPAFPDTVVLLLRDPGQVHAPSVGLLVDAFGLTPREAQLALALRDGAALSHAAWRLGITEGTARQYLKCVFAKTGVRRQSELVALLSGLA